jgi:hypothetical protein
VSSAFEGASPGAPAWLWAWLRERVLAWWLVPLGFVISFAGGMQGVMSRAVVAMFALVALRLGDDLEDVEHDRLQHPERVLCRLSSLRAAYCFCGFALFISCVLIVAVGGSWQPFLTALFCVFAASRTRQRISHSAIRVLFAHVILVKIPALVVALAPDGVSGGIVFGRALALYGVVGIYEVAHDAEARRSRFAPFMLLIDILSILWGLAIWRRIPIP